MDTFTSIKELLSTLSREHKLLAEMFEKRKSLSYKYDFALAMVDFNEDRIQYLINHSVIRQNGTYLEIDDQFLQFFEQVLEVNEEINTSYINENIQNVKQNILYYLQENNENRKYNYLRAVKNALRKIGIITIRNVVDLKRNIDNTFKNEPNYKIKKAKLENLDRKRIDINALIDQTEKLISEEEQTFFKSALDEELNRIIIQLKLQLNECRHNLIEIQKQIIEYLNQIKYQSGVIERLRQLKYLRDQFIIRPSTNIESLLAKNNAVIFEPNPIYPLKLSLDYLQTDDAAYESIRKISKRVRSGVNIKLSLAGNISNEYLETQIEEEIQINLEEVKNSFVASGNNLFEFVLGYNFAKEISFDERVTVYCQLISQYESIFNVTEKFNTQKEIEYAMVYPI
ncbi:MAG: hypothetical protein M0Z70_01400 [Nitrospiraceae bacterium]|nr:hypothetical protein [Nitrospirota bacterium]MDA8337940.1 hypothetical protein [Nitrospiraceae bacterium]